MKSFVQESDSHFGLFEKQSSGKLSFFRFLFRYPVFLLIVGPPIFRANTGIDATKGEIDFWALFQVAWVGVIGSRAMMRLLSAHTILIPKQARSILRLLFILGLLFIASAEYSPSRLVSFAYSILYLLTVICVVEFFIDAYKNPPDWIQSLFIIRMIAFLLLLLVVLTIPVASDYVMSVLPGAGIRLSGGAVAPIAILSPMIFLISAYAFLFSLESTTRSVFFILVGLAGTMTAQSRGIYLSLAASMVLLGMIWAGSSRRRSYLFITTTFASVLFGGAVLAAVGGSRIWNLFNRGQSMEGVESASGRTVIWNFVIHYCISHPLGMGYIAGFRKIFKQYFALGLQIEVSHIGNAHNAFMDILADAGWPALAVYLILLFKVFAMGWRFARKNAIFTTASEALNRHALRCAIVLLFFCMAAGLDSADFSVPLRSAFYTQHVLIIIILCISSRMLVASRTRSTDPAHNVS